MKLSLDDLAIFGGKPLFDRALHVGQPNVVDQVKLLKRMSEVLESRWFTNNGPQVQEFEAQIARTVAVRHCVAMCNATTALQIAIRAANLSGEVIVPSFTFVATAHALQWQGITPVFCDIDGTFCLDTNRIEELITPRTSGIIGVHLWGHTCNVEALDSICRRHNLTLLFDAAHAFGCSRNGVMVGRFGRAEVFSFHATKFLNTFEGGAVVTDDDEFADCCRAMRNFGFSGEDQVSALGVNGKMNEFEAVMGLTSLEHMEEIVATNRGNYLEYHKELRDIHGLILVDYPMSEQNNFQYVVIDIREKAGITRDQLHALLQAEGILARRYFYPGCHRMEPYRTLYPRAGRCLPRTERACASMLCLPTGTAVGAETVHDICGLLRYVVNNNVAIRARLTKTIVAVANSGESE